MPPLVDSSSEDGRPRTQDIASRSSREQTSESEASLDSSVSESTSCYSFYYFPTLGDQLGSEIDAQQPPGLNNLCNDSHLSVNSGFGFGEASKPPLTHSSSSCSVSSRSSSKSEFGITHRNRWRRDVSSPTSGCKRKMGSYSNSSGIENLCTPLGEEVAVDLPQAGSLGKSARGKSSTGILGIKCDSGTPTLFSPAGTLESLQERFSGVPQVFREAGRMRSNPELLPKRGSTGEEEVQRQEERWKIRCHNAGTPGRPGPLRPVSASFPTFNGIRESEHSQVHRVESTTKVNNEVHHDKGLAARISAMRTNEARERHLSDWLWEQGKRRERLGEILDPSPLYESGDDQSGSIGCDSSTVDATPSTNASTTNRSVAPSKSNSVKLLNSNRRESAIDSTKSSNRTDSNNKSHDGVRRWNDPHSRRRSGRRDLDTIQENGGVSVSAPTFNDGVVGPGKSAGSVAVSAPTSATDKSGTSAGSVVVSTPASTSSLEEFKDQIRCQENPFSALTSRQLKKLIPEKELEAFSKEVRKTDVWKTSSPFSVYFCGYSTPSWKSRLTSDRDSILGSKSASVSVEFPGSIEPVKCLLIESGGFHDFVEEHDWHDVDVEIALPGRDRTYLLTQLGVDKSCSISTIVSGNRRRRRCGRGRD